MLAYAPKTPKFRRSPGYLTMVISGKYTAQPPLISRRQQEGPHKGSSSLFSVVYYRQVHPCRPIPPPSPRPPSAVRQMPAIVHRFVEVKKRGKD